LVKNFVWGRSGYRLPEHCCINTVLDEPTVRLDQTTSLEIILDLNKQGMTMLLTTHYMDEVEYLCNRIGIMDNGKLISLGTLQQLRSTHGERLSDDKWASAGNISFPQPGTSERLPRPANRQNRHDGTPLEDIFCGTNRTPTRLITAKFL